MDTHLEVHEWLGCQEKSGRVPAPNLRPVAMEPKSARVVWGERVVTRMTAPFKAKGVFTNLAPYDSELYRARRMLAETVLGYLVTQPESNRYVVAAVRRVSANILKWWTDFRKRTAKTDEDLVKHAEKYLYGKTSYGRLEFQRSATDNINMWCGLIQDTRQANVPSVMCLHDHFGRILSSFDKGSREGGIYEAWGRTLRPEGAGGWLHKDLRGRDESAKPEDAKVTDLPGLLQTDWGMCPFDVNKCLQRLGLNVDGMRTQARIRARDWVKYSAARMHAGFRQGLEDYNLYYIAGPSGTTATLFMTAFAFGLQPKTDECRQYLLAIIGYLVGGGMHSCHESFSTASLAGVSQEAGKELVYALGKYSRMMPNDFRRSRLYDDWACEFWDVASPGAAQSWASMRT